jgi:hypothetical protein
MADYLLEWQKIPDRIRRSVRSLGDPDLELRGGSDDWSIRETVHHLVEANLIASNMIIAALATDGGYFDWTWVNPDKEWMRRVGYSAADIRPATDLLAAVCRHISQLLEIKPRSLRRKVRLSDFPDGPPYEITVDEILQQEVEHAEQHLSDIINIRREHSI